MERAEKFIWFTAGAGGAAGLTYLFATSSGKRLRRQMHRIVEQEQSRMVEGGKDLLQRSKELAADIREFLPRGSGAFSLSR